MKLPEYIKTPGARDAIEIEYWDKLLGCACRGLLENVASDEGQSWLWYSELWVTELRDWIPCMQDKFWMIFFQLGVVS